MTATSAAIRAETFTQFANRIGAHRGIQLGETDETVGQHLTREDVLDRAVAAYWRRRFPAHQAGRFLVPARDDPATAA